MKKVYLFMLLAISSATVFGQACHKLFFSEYVEGSSNNKALEIYNPTSAPVSLFGYKIQSYSNGNNNPGSTFNLNATIAAGDVYVLVYSQSTDTANLRSKADTITGNGALSFNGNDAVVLMYGIDTIDKIGIIGNDPGVGGWSVDTAKTTNHTLIRKSSVQLGVATWDTAQWTTLPQDTNRLGAHTGPTGLTPCTILPQDTVASFNPTSGTFTGINGNYNLTIQLSLPHIDSMSLDVALTSGNAQFLNNYTTQSVGFGTAVIQRNLTVTVTNTDSATHVFTFKLVNPSAGLVIGADSIFTLTVNAPAVQPTDSCATLFFSEYVEGSASNKALEIYNPTAAAVNLLGYRIQGYFNGSPLPGSTFNLSGSIAAGDVFVIVYSSADTLKPYADTVTANSVVNFSGNDALALMHGPDTLDIIGVIGDTVSNWSVAGGSTQNHTLIRAASVKKGNNNWAVASGQWTALPQDSVQLGSHTGPVNQTACSLSPLAINEVEFNNISRVYPNPNSGSFTIELKEIRNSAEVKVYDLAGRMVYNTTENSNLMHIGIGNLSQGIYVVEVKTGNLSSRSKITVQ
jgi:predicted extracellular nuclease